MAQEQEPLRDGLEGVIVAETMLSRVDGARGQLVIRGRDVETLAGDTPFEGVCGLLWTGDPSPEALQPALGRAREQAFENLDRLGDALANPDPMESLRTALAHLRFPPDTSEADERVAITGAVAVLVAAWARRHLQDAPPVRPDPARGHAEDTLRMTHGQAPGAACVAGLDSYLSTVAEHGMNASTFTARVVASTGSDTVSAVVAAVGALKGPLHGGVPGPVLEMLDAIGEPGNARAWLTAELDAGRRIMGMGHRVYRVRDPAGRRLRDRRREAGAGGRRQQSALAGAGRSSARRASSCASATPTGRSRRTSSSTPGVLLDAVGLHRALFTPVFALGARGRLAGAHRRAAAQRPPHPAQGALRRTIPPGGLSTLEADAFALAGRRGGDPRARRLPDLDPLGHRRDGRGHHPARGDAALLRPVDRDPAARRRPAGLEQLAGRRPAPSPALGDHRPLRAAAAADGLRRPVAGAGAATVGGPRVDRGLRPRGHLAAGLAAAGHAPRAGRSQRPLRRARRRRRLPQRDRRRDGSADRALLPEPRPDALPARRHQGRVSDARPRREGPSSSGPWASPTALTSHCSPCCARSSSPAPGSGAACSSA